MILSLYFILQNSIDSLGNSVVEGMTSPTKLDETITFLDVFKEGGFIIWLLTGMFLLCTYIFGDRYVALKNAKKAVPGLQEEVMALILNAKLSEAQARCKRDHTPAAKMLEVGLAQIIAGAPLKSIESSLENKAGIEVYKLEQNISILGTISKVAPMLGFLGTVLGMVQAFMAISQEEGAVSPKLLSTGIYEAMYTTIGGLFVGIFAYIAYSYLSRRIAGIIQNMKITAVNLLNSLQKK